MTRLDRRNVSLAARRCHCVCRHRKALSSVLQRKQVSLELDQDRVFTGYRSHVPEPARVATQIVNRHAMQSTKLQIWEKLGHRICQRELFRDILRGFDDSD